MCCCRKAIRSALGPAVALEDLAPEPLALLDIEPSRDYFLSLFKDRGLEPTIAFARSRWRRCEAL